MKRFFIFVVSLMAVFIGTFSVSGQEVTTDMTSEQTTTFPELTISEDSFYTFTDYDELISQLYEKVYDDIYDDLYNQIVSDIDTQFYEDIYDLVEQNADQLLIEEEISVYIDDFQQMLYDVVGLAENSVLGIMSYLGSEPVAVGSAVIYRYEPINQNYYIITNHHVIAEGNNFSVVFEDGMQYVANLIGYDTEVDIAILSFYAPDQENIQVSVLGDSSTLAQGMFLIAAGNPQGLNFYGSVTLGLISGLERKVDENEYIGYLQHDSAINPGNSGGPVYNLDGEVVGINVSKYAITEIEGMGFAIPINLVKRIIERIEDNNLNDNTIMPRLGADYYDVSEYLSNGTVTVRNLTINGTLISENITLTLPLGITSGLLLYEIHDNSTVSSSPLESGDLVYRINNHTILNNQDYFNYVYNNFEAGDTITIYYYELNHDTLEYSTLMQSVDVILK
ncbi:MAG: S1C family serine protease [Candidatus Izemoplasmatales bacterium]